MKPNVRLSAITSSLVLISIFLIAFFLSACTKEGPEGPAGGSGSNELMDPSILPDLVSTFPANNETGPFGLYAPGTGYYLPHFVVQFNKLINVGVLPPNVVRILGFSRPVYVRPYSYIIYNDKRARPLSPPANGPFDYIFSFFVYDSLRGATEPYDIGTTYTVIIDTTLFDINGNHPARRLVFSYTPEPYFRTVAIVPSNGSTNLNRRTEPYIYFNSRVNSAILSQLSISPAVGGDWYLYTYDSLSVYFSYSTPFSFHTAYTVNVDASATDATGHQIHAATSSTFTTGTLGISYSSPSNGSTMVNPMTQIELDFNDEVDTASVRTALSITPPVPGALSIYSNYCYLYPTQPLIPATQYTVTLSTALKSTDGFHAESPIAVRFTTAPFSISSTSPYDQSTDVSRSSYCYIYCNSFIDTGSVRSAFHIHPATPGYFQLYPGADYFAFSPTSLLQASTLYTVTIDSTLRAVGGSPLGAPYSFTFITGQY
ncbi:MAG TPA: Ig-like domain-containing protein [Bacteroidota bacterium]|nr:Ig-like domain-containing protein [Bacteroidota bacterium]